MWRSVPIRQSNPINLYSSIHVVVKIQEKYDQYNVYLLLSSYAWNPIQLQQYIINVPINICNDFYHIIIICLLLLLCKISLTTVLFHRSYQTTVLRLSGQSASFCLVTWNSSPVCLEQEPYYFLYAVFECFSAAYLPHNQNMACKAYCANIYNNNPKISVPNKIYI